MVLTAALLVCVAVLVNFFLFLTCFRERLALGVGVAVYVFGLVVKAAPAFAAPHGQAVREIFLFLWASAALTSLGLLKSALRAPPPDFRRS
jgi:hypothetical protein